MAAPATELSQKRSSKSVGHYVLGMTQRTHLRRRCSTSRARWLRFSSSRCCGATVLSLSTGSVGSVPCAVPAAVRANVHTLTMSCDGASRGGAATDARGCERAALGLLRFLHCNEVGAAWRALMQARRWARVPSAE
jgi:hypothetical protein